VVLAVVGLLPFAALHAAGAVSFPSPTAWAYPPTPRTATGGDPLAQVAKPVECGPERDGQSSGNYYPLARLPQRTGVNPSLPTAPFTTVLTLVNQKPQTFNIYVSAGSQAAVAQFISTASACLEAVPLTRRIPDIVQPVQFDSMLIQAAEDETSLTQAELADLRNQFVGDGPPTFRAVVAEAGADPDSVIADAVQAADAALQDKVASGELSAAEVAAVDTPTVLESLADEPGADFLVSPDELPNTPAGIATRLRGDTTGAVVIATRPASHLEGKRNIIWFAFDPKIDEGQAHDYLAQCRTLAEAQIRSWAGKERLRLRRNNDPLEAVGSKATAPDFSGKLALNSHIRRSYDAYVNGLQDGSDYSIYGSQLWLRGKGGGC
jgi:hypothetical protein